MPEPRGPSLGVWLYRTKKMDGSYHPRWRFRYTGPYGRKKTASGFADKKATLQMAYALALEANLMRLGLKTTHPSDIESRRPIRGHVEEYMAWGRV